VPDVPVVPEPPAVPEAPVYEDPDPEVALLPPIPALLLLASSLNATDRRVMVWDVGSVATISPMSL
jgi:hypothetical protein